MQRRVSRDDLIQIMELAQRSGEARSKWWICEEYEIRGEEIVSKHLRPRFSAALGDSDARDEHHWRAYRPLEEVPDLFLKLASLSEERNFAEVALDFSHTYGVPGGTSLEKGGQPDRMSLASFRNEAKRAWEILQAYEAVLNHDIQMAPFAGAADIRLAFLEWFAAKLGEALEADELHYLSIELKREAERKRSEKGEPPSLTSEERQRGLLREVLHVVLLQVERTVQKLCRQGISWEWDFLSLELDPYKIRSTWQFDNLLGAAYLQMWWLMTSGGDLGRCEHCGRVMSLSRPAPGSRKRRNDKRFCNDACRQGNYRIRKSS